MRWDTVEADITWPYTGRERRPRRDFEENTPSRSAGAVVFISRAAGPSRIFFVKIVHILIKTPCNAVEKAVYYVRIQGVPPYLTRQDRRMLPGPLPHPFPPGLLKK